MGAALTVGAREGRPLSVQAGGQAADGGGRVLRAAAGGGVAAGAIVCSIKCSFGTSAAVGSGICVNILRQQAGRYRQSLPCVQTTQGIHTGQLGGAHWATGRGW